MDFGVVVLLVLIGTVVIASLPFISFFALRWFVRYCATRHVPVRVKKPDGTYDIKMQLKPVVWCFVPENCTAYLQRKGNELKSEGEEGSKATPASGSGIVDVIHNVPGKVLDRRSADLKDWELRDPKKDADGNIIEFDNHRKGLMYKLFGAHYIGLNELRWVKINEVRLSPDKDALQKYNAEIEAWEAGDQSGIRPRQPAFQMRLISYETLFPYYSREHGVAVRESETAGAYTLDLFTSLKYVESFPVRARIEVADPNAMLTELVEQEVNGETGSHQPEYFLQPSVPSEDVPEGLTVKKRRRRLIKRVTRKVGVQALSAIGITVKKFILYSVDMDPKQRELLELQEKTEREEQARIRTSKREIEVNENNALAAIAKAEGDAEVKVIMANAEAEAKMLQNIADGDEIITVEGAIDKLHNAPAIRFALAYERNKTITTLTIAPGKDSVLPLGSMSNAA